MARTCASALALLLLLGGVAAADTIKSGGNIINETWTPAGSPYIIQGDITVPAGSFLHIEAGTTVQFATGDMQSAGVDTNRVELVVVGQVQMNGTAGMPVQLVGASPASGSWYGIVVDATATGAALTLANVTMASPTVGIYHRSATATATTSNVTMSSVSVAGMRIEAGAPTYNGIATSGGTYGFEITSGGSVNLTNCLARNTTSFGVRFGSSTVGRTVNLTNCTLHANGNYGVYSNASSGGSVTITNSIITSSSYGIYRNDSTSYLVTYSDVWNNSSANYSSVVPGTGCISSNPLYVSATNLRLTSNSPARFGAMGAGDMGALPYTTDATPGLYGVLWTPTTFTAAGGPYNVGGDLSVGPGVTVTMQAGAVLTFATDDIMRSGVDVNRGELVVHGTLVATGTNQSAVQLVGASAAAGSWYGIVVDASATGTALMLSNVTLTSPTVGIYHRSATASASTASINMTSVSVAGLRVEAGAPTYNGIATAGGTYGFEITSGGSVTLVNCAARNTTSFGVRFGSSTVGRTVTLSHCTLHANGNYGVYSNASSGGSITITSSLITGSSYGVYRNDSTSYLVTYSDVWNNSSANYSSVVAGVGCISSNPQYVSATDLRLMTSSVAIDAGTATGAPTTDQRGVTRPLDGDGINGAAPDMGAYEFILTPACGNGALEPGETCDSGAANGMYGACNASCSALGPRCGDGITNGPEQCDDGNTVETDACLASCTFGGCGDGVIRAGVEECDDGNTIGTDACTASCQNAECGDGVVRMGTEACDDGNADNTDACNTSCMVINNGNPGGTPDGGVDPMNPDGTPAAGCCQTNAETSGLASLVVIVGLALGRRRLRLR